MSPQPHLLLAPPLSPQKKLDVPHDPVFPVRRWTVRARTAGQALQDRTGAPQMPDLFQDHVRRGYRAVLSQEYL